MDYLRIFSSSFQDNWDLPALTDLSSGLTLNYGDIASRMKRIHLILNGLGVTQGCRVGIVGYNSIDWVVAYMGVLTYGAVAVSLPVNSTHEETVSALNEVGIELLFIDTEVFNDSYCCNDIPCAEAVISMDTQSVMCSRMGNTRNPQALLDSIDNKFIEMFPYGFSEPDTKAPVIMADSPAAIFFTTGTTGRPKPVVLMADNLEGNIIFGIRNSLHPRKSSTLSTTSYGSVWGTIFNMLIPLASGSHVTVMRNFDNIDALIDGLMKVKPQRIMLSPQYVDPIVRRAINEYNSSFIARFSKNLPVKNNIRNIYLRKAINRMLGGECRELVIGSVFLSSWLANQLRIAQVPHTVVYGLTECGGLVSYTSCVHYKPGTMGRPVSPLVKCRLRPISLDGYPDGLGVLEVKGMNLMKGYNLSRESIDRNLTTDGWFSTGDICSFDSDGDMILYGRLDSILHTDKGLVIPERIEILINERPEVTQCLLNVNDGCLTANIYPNYGYIHRNYDNTPDDVIRNLVNDINRILPFKDHIDRYHIHESPMPTTWKGTVKRNQV
ncbi:MAG: AMP-binding protein [Clostridiales bacterium]|nr:AMP-binding protein [Clostridiales bacterium]